MHHYWVGLAADLFRMGRRHEADLIIGYVVDGDILGSGHAEVGNDIPMALSTTSASRVEGGWRITGRKMFGSLGPHWNRLGFHAMDVSDLTAPVVVHAFVPHDAPGLTTVPNWDAQGMRATESHDTVLEDVFVPDSDVLCVVPAGPPSHPAVAVMQVWAVTLIANVYVVVPPRDGAGAAVTGRAGRALSSRYRRVHPRDHRQGTARRGRRRAPLVTLTRPVRPPPLRGPPGCGCARRAW
jgi:hypothetical protein